MKAVYIKELYEQAGPLEFHLVNPYVQAIGELKSRKPDCTVTRVKTVFGHYIDHSDSGKPFLVPLLEVYYT